MSKRILTALAALAVAANASATVIALFDFDPDESDGRTWDLDASDQTYWTTTNLIDIADPYTEAEGREARNFTQDTLVNQLTTSVYSDMPEGTPDTSNVLRMSARDLDVNDDHDFTSTITADGGKWFDFTDHEASAMTYAWQTLGGSIQGSFTLSYRTDEMNSWTSLGLQDGANNTTSRQWTGEKLTWDLDEIGSQVTYVEFKMFVDHAAGGTNGLTGDRGVGFDDFTINATVIPEPATTSLLVIAFAGIAIYKSKLHRG